MLVFETLKNKISHFLNSNTCFCLQLYGTWNHQNGPQSDLIFFYWNSSEKWTSKCLIYFDKILLVQFCCKIQILLIKCMSLISYDLVTIEPKFYYYSVLYTWAFFNHSELAQRNSTSNPFIFRKMTNGFRQKYSRLR